MNLETINKRLTIQGIESFLSAWTWILRTYAGQIRWQGVSRKYENREVAFYRLLDDHQTNKGIMFAMQLIYEAELNANLIVRRSMSL